MQQDGSRADILIVDDVVENLDFLSAELTVNGYYTRPVNSGKLALMAARASPPDIVLLDILMPEMDGYQVCEAFKTNPQIRDIPIIFISGLNETIDKVRAFQSGAVDYITKPFQLEEVLARINTHVTLYRQRQELEQQRQLKARFLSMATHEFRTPLAVIRSAADMLLRYSDRLSADEQAKRLNTINQEVAEMDQLIGEVLAYNRMDMGRLDFHPEAIDIKALCDKIVERFCTIADTRLLTYAVEDGLAPAAVDSRLMDHILSNLLSNAFKYSPSGNPVQFLVSQGEAYVVFKVADQGIGIPTEDQKHLFSPFYRASNAGRINGTGLGLAIVKQYVDRHGGSIHFESQENVGTTFIVQIPRNQP
jgi:signal transduction histidine kinase